MAKSAPLRQWLWVEFPRALHVASQFTELEFLAPSCTPLTVL